jgi:hypothetical protein
MTHQSTPHVHDVQSSPSPSWPPPPRSLPVLMMVQANPLAMQALNTLFSRSLYFSSNPMDNAFWITNPAPFCDAPARESKTTYQCLHVSSQDNEGLSYSAFLRVEPSSSMLSNTACGVSGFSVAHTNPVTPEGNFEPSPASRTWAPAGRRLRPRSSVPTGTKATTYINCLSSVQVQSEYTH